MIGAMGNSKGTVLIAGINEKLKLLLSTLCIKEGYWVTLASLAGEVIRTVQDTSIDIMIIDVELSGMKGYEVIPIVKRINPAVIVIVTSDDSSLELARKIRENDIFFYAVKPLDLDEMELALRDASKKIGKVSNLCGTRIISQQ